MATLEAQRVATSGDIDIDVNMDRDMLQSLVGSAAEGGGGEGGGGYLGLLRILIYAIIALSPVLSAAIGAAGAAIIGFASALTAAAGAAAVLGGGLVGLIAQFKNTDPSDRTPAMRDFAESIKLVKDAWDEFIKAIGDAGFDLMGEGLELVAGILPQLAPLFNKTAEAVSGLLDGVRAFVGGPEFQRMLDFFGDFGVDMLTTFLRIGGNLLLFFGRLFEAIAPFARQMMAGLEEVTAGWAEWADNLSTNDAFQHFVDQALENGPKLLDMLGSMLDAFLAIGHALEPFAGPMIEGLTRLFDLIANVPTQTLTALIAGLAGLWLGLNVLAPLLTFVVDGMGALAAAIGAVGAPVILIVAAIAAIVAALIYLWRTNDDFHDRVVQTWNEIKETIMPIVHDIVKVIRQNWGPISEWLRGIMRDWVAIVRDNFTSLMQVIRAILAVIRFIWRNWGKDIIQVAKGMVQVVGGIIRGFFQVVRGIFHVIRSVLTGDWRGAWQGIKQIAQGFATAIGGIVRGLGNILRGLFSAMSTTVRGIFNGMTDGIRGMLSALVSWARGQWNNFKSIFTVHINVGDIFGGIVSAFRGAVNTIVNWWNGLSFSIPGFDPPGPGPKFGGITFSPPDIHGFATGAYVTDPTLAWVGEGNDSEIVAPEPKLREIVRENSGGAIDYAKIGAAVAAALATVIGNLRGVSSEDLERLIEAASVYVSVEAESTDKTAEAVARQIAKAIGFELRTLGYGGKYAA